MDHAANARGQSPGHGLRLDSRPVYRQVDDRIRGEILSGRLVAGPRLPSSRTLAAELGIARGTVVTAFQMLAGEGYTASAGARGTVVNVALPRAQKSRPAADPTHADKARRTINKPSVPRLFQVGLPALDAFPRKQWTQIAVRVRRQLEHEQMVNPNLYDVDGLRAFAARDRELFADRAGHYVLRRPNSHHCRLPRGPRPDRSGAAQARRQGLGRGPGLCLRAQSPPGSRAST